MIKCDKGRIEIAGTLPQVLAETFALMSGVVSQAYKSVPAEDREAFRHSLFAEMADAIARTLTAMKEVDAEEDGVSFTASIGKEVDMTDLLKKVLGEE